MKTSLRQLQQDLKRPSHLALFILSLVPLFPEYISFFLVLLSGFFALKDMRKNKKSLELGTIGKLLIAFIAFMSVTLIYSTNRISTLVTILMWGFFLLAYLILYNVLTDTDRFDALMLFITGVAGVVGLIACCQYRIGFYTGGNPIQIWEWLDNIVYDFLPIEVSKTPYTLRACSTFANPNILSQYLITVAPFVVYFNFYERRSELRMFCRVCLFLTFGGILFTFSRGGYLAMLVLLVALMLLNLRRRFATVTLYGICAALLIPDEVVNRFLTIIPGIKLGHSIIESSPSLPGVESMTTTSEIINNSTADLATNERFRIWMESIEAIFQRPIHGYGAGTEVTHELLVENGVNAIHAHNIIVQLLLEGGIILLAIMLLIGIKVVINGIKLMRNTYRYAFWIGFAVLGFAANFIIQGMVDYPLLTPKLVCNFMMIMAITDCANKLYPERTVAETAPVHPSPFRRWFCKQ